MRLTTKIITGFIGSVFLLSLLFIIGFSFTDRKFNNAGVVFTNLNIPQENKSGIQLEHHRVIVFESEEPDAEYPVYTLGSETCGLFLSPPTPAGVVSELFFPEGMSACIFTQMNCDTLIVKLKFDEIRKKYQETDEKEKDFNNTPTARIGIVFTGFNLYLQTSQVNIVNQLNNLPVYINSIKTDSIIVYSESDITIDSCKANVVTPDLRENYKKLTITNSAFKKLHLDLDRIHNWNIHNCEIETSNYTGSGQKNIRLDKNEHGTINWRPKNDNAELNLKFKGDSTQIHFQIQ
jgi:hypothetical protein